MSYHLPGPHSPSIPRKSEPVSDDTILTIVTHLVTVVILQQHVDERKHLPLGKVDLPSGYGLLRVIRMK